MTKEIPLPQAALRIGRSWKATLALALKGELGTTHQVAGRWLVSEAGVEAFLLRQDEARAATTTGKASSNP